MTWEIEARRQVFLFFFFWNVFLHLIHFFLHLLIKSISPSSSPPLYLHLSRSFRPPLFRLSLSFSSTLNLPRPLSALCDFPAAVDWWWEKSPKDRRLVKDRPVCSVCGSKWRWRGGVRGDNKERSTLIPQPCSTCFFLLLLLFFFFPFPSL